MELKRIFSKKTLSLASLYIVLALIALVGAYLLRFDFYYPDIHKYFLAKTIIVFIFTKLFFLAWFRQFKILLKFFHTTDITNLFWTFTASALFVFVLSQITINHSWVIPRGVIMIDYFLSIILFTSIRMLIRFKAENSQTYSMHNINKRVVIVGAGDIGSNLASNLLDRKAMGIEPILFLDDDPQKIGNTISGLDVLPIKTNLKKLVAEFKIDRAIIAIAKISRSRLNEITSEFSKLGIETSIVPSYHDLTMGYAKVSDLKKVSIEDVLGRKEVSLNVSELDNLIKGKTILVTGAGGSIGNEICNQVAKRNPANLILLDQCEVQLFKVTENILRGNFNIEVKSIVCDVAEKDSISKLIAEHKPQVIFHAAAHKHVPIMELQPAEAIKNNVLGSYYTALAAAQNGVEKFVFISTDKAVNPTNVMGTTKRLAEILLHSFTTNKEIKTQFTAVRFGNVLGSSGSVIPIFKRQIEEGGPVTVTHPEVMRYFMSIPEAASLVLQCASLANGGEIFVLNMGEQIKILDLAKQMIVLSGLEPEVDIKIEFIGLRDGEKLQEELQNNMEHLAKTKNPQIFVFVSEPISFRQTEEIVKEIQREISTKNVTELKLLLKKHVPEYTPQIN